MARAANATVAERPGLDIVISDVLRERILAAVLAPGTHLVEVEFSTEFGVAHGTIRAALRHLQAEGLVEFRPRRGMYVITIEPEDVLELCSLRDALEALGSSLAAKRIDKSQKVSLKAIVSAMRDAAAANDRARMIELDFSFHQLIIEMSQHKRLQQSYGTLASQVRLFMALTDPLHRDLKEMASIHAALAEPIIAGDAERSGLLASTHNQPDGLALVAKMREAQRGSQRKGPDPG